jgi:hypothetical protein
MSGTYISLYLPNDWSSMYHAIITIQCTSVVDCWQKCKAGPVQRHEDVWGSEYIDPRFHDLHTSLRGLSTSGPGNFNPRERPPVPII